MRTAIILALTVGVTALASPPTTCGSGDDPYAKALCAYQRRQFDVAQSGFRALLESDDPGPQTIRAAYFLARTEMKLGRWEEAETLLVRIYAMSPSFYDEWNCDFLLGLCRRAQGKS